MQVCHKKYQYIVKNIKCLTQLHGNAVILLFFYPQPANLVRNSNRWPVWPPQTTRRQSWGGHQKLANETISNHPIRAEPDRTEPSHPTMKNLNFASKPFIHPVWHLPSFLSMRFILPPPWEAHGLHLCISFNHLLPVCLPESRCWAARGCTLKIN